ncbi:nicotinate dehydrogenase subunit A [Neorhizobium galegae]|uniref:(2Fe-2S)-binding protein n=1 Tax=Neorhizobium galegae TaxID=399 RepID=UPI001AE5793A|nr:(2Fe-2S)-binding protein [Neorhizobium galegae]MBP2549131.1 nicotinate dehydrogenase subunit A [Neorhizobium galegae]
MTTQTVTLTINGRAQDFALDPQTPLLYVLRNDCGLNGAKFGCGLGECGACTVLLGDRPVRACTTRIGAVRDRPITTLEGLSSGGEHDGRTLHPVQQAFLEMQAAQCGYCLSGMIMATVGLLTRNPQADEKEIRAALRHQLCRCGTHMEILAAVRLARDRMAEMAAGHAGCNPINAADPPPRRRPAPDLEASAP